LAPLGRPPLFRSEAAGTHSSWQWSSPLRASLRWRPSARSLSLPGFPWKPGLQS